MPTLTVARKTLIAGSIVYDVEVPNFRENFALSGIALTSADARRTVTVSPPGKMVTFSLALRDGAGRILDRLDVARDSDEKPAGPSTYPFSPGLSLADVEPESYVLEVTAGSFARSRGGDASHPNRGPLNPRS